MKRSLTLATMIALGAAAFVPLASHAQTDFNLYINSTPPAPRFESVPAPRHGYVWAPGYWNWEGNRHNWSAGHWERARDGQRYQSSEWVRENNGWRLNRGGWQSVGVASYGDVRIAPPQPRYEPVPHPRDGYLWAPGHWEWRGNRHEWTSGIWIQQRPGYVYEPSTWVERDGRWSMEQGRWNPRGYDRGHDQRHARRDRDHDRDGVPDRYDRDRDNDGVPNRYDRDRDGDGVPNERDSRPDNPRRY